VARRLVAMIDRYRSTAQLRPAFVCKFIPSCSLYAREAITARGAVIGSVLTVWRVLRCNRWSAGGDDPAPLGRRRLTGTAAADAAAAERPDP